MSHQHVVQKEIRAVLKVSNKRFYYLRLFQVRIVGLTEVAEAPVEPMVTQTGSVGPVAASIIGTVTFLVALFPVKALRTACTPRKTKSRASDHVVDVQKCSQKAAHHPGTSLR